MSDTCTCATSKYLVNISLKKKEMKAVINVVILGSAEQLFAGKKKLLSGSNEFVIFLELPLFVQSCLSYFQRENACAATPVALMAPVVVGTPAHAQTKRVTVRAAKSSVAAQVSSMCRDIIRLLRRQFTKINES